MVGLLRAMKAKPNDRLSLLLTWQNEFDRKCQHTLHLVHSFFLIIGLWRLINNLCRKTIHDYRRAKQAEDIPVQVDALQDGL
jgi:hypothetical protein